MARWRHYQKPCTVDNRTIDQEQNADWDRRRHSSHSYKPRRCIFTHWEVLLFWTSVLPVKRSPRFSVHWELWKHGLVGFSLFTLWEEVLCGRMHFVAVQACSNRPSLLLQVLHPCLYSTSCTVVGGEVPYATSDICPLSLGPYVTSEIWKGPFNLYINEWRPI